MNEIETKNVHRLLVKRCHYAYQVVSQEEELYFDSGEREQLPDRVLALKLPEDFIEYYKRYDGGHQNFDRHGWPGISGTASLILFALRQMEESRQRLYRRAASRLKELDEWSGCGETEKENRIVRLKKAMERILVVGAVEGGSPSQRDEFFLIFYQDSFLVLPELHDTADKLYETDDWFRIATHADRSFYDLLNRLLDILLKEK